MPPKPQPQKAAPAPGGAKGAPAAGGELRPPVTPSAAVPPGAPPAMPTATSNIRNVDIGAGAYSFSHAVSFFFFIAFLVTTDG